MMQGTAVLGCIWPTSGPSKKAFVVQQLGESPWSAMPFRDCKKSCDACRLFSARDGSQWFRKFESAVQSSCRNSVGLSVQCGAWCLWCGVLCLGSWFTKQAHRCCMRQGEDAPDKAPFKKCLQQHVSGLAWLQDSAAAVESALSGCCTCVLLGSAKHNDAAIAEERC